jgi:hypothetical protein
MTLIDQLLEQFNKMDEVQQQRLLNFARILPEHLRSRGKLAQAL